VRTQVAIVGAGPSGLLLSQLLAARGVESVVVEHRSAEHVAARIRAGVLEQATVDLLVEAGVGDRLKREAGEHHGIYLKWPDGKHLVDFVELTGRSTVVYGQSQLQRDLVEAAALRGQEIHHCVSATALHDLDTDRPAVTFTDASGRGRRLQADVVVGCDGSFGPSRDTVPVDVRIRWEKDCPNSWLGILADVAPSTDHVLYAWHPEGFAMHSMRSPAVSRLYLQVPRGTRVEDWSDDRIWDALSRRLGSGQDGFHLSSGPINDKSVLPMRSLVQTPMRHGRLFLAGDAAHILPPTGAKGLNLALADVALLAPALADLVRGDTRRADDYSDRALRRVWRSTHFAWWMTNMLHPTGDPFEDELQLSQLRWVASSRAASTGLAENFAGYPLEV